ncbi:hypothetical protein [Pseudalkalibacillus hwajinpoensis]|nr:hypothetical protein [Pseudalkalibacillus hwajinpoensis]
MTSSENYDQETKNKAKASVERFIVNNYENVDSVEFTNVIKVKWVD